MKKLANLSGWKKKKNLQKKKPRNGENQLKMSLKAITKKILTKIQNSTISFLVKSICLCIYERKIGNGDNNYGYIKSKRYKTNE